MFWDYRHLAIINQINKTKDIVKSIIDRVYYTIYSTMDE